LQLLEEEEVKEEEPVVSAPTRKRLMLLNA
jgi:hypothetical protein